MDITTKLQRDNPKLLEFCNKHNKIYLYGAGIVGSIIIDFLHSCEIFPVAFITSKIEGEQILYKNIPVISVDSLQAGSGEGIVVTTSDKYWDQILETIEKKGVFSRTDVFIVRDYISGSSKYDYIGTEKNGPFFSKYTFLDDLGRTEGTDKNADYHNYLHIYEFFLKDLKDKNVLLLELGVFHGESLRMWKKYFSRGRIIGVDIDKNCQQYKEERIEIITGDLSEISTYEGLRELEAKIIIDDALHAWSHQIKAFTELFPAMPSGGVYIMEDIGTSFRNYKNSIYADLRVSAYEFMEAICELTAGHDLAIHDQLIECKEEMEAIAMQIDMISFIYGSCIVIKK